MSRISASTVAAGFLVAFAGAGCSAAAPASTSQPQPAARAPNAADVQFMAGMIPHHAQAIRMAAWAPANGASPSVRVLAERIIVAQRDEIELMQGWLRDNRQKVPPADATHMKMMHDGVEHDMLMPGMLTDDEMTRLQNARGVEFDRLFLTFMIRHHEGAIKMVDDLFRSYGAAQDEEVFRLASDVYADQTTEIDRMNQMIAALPGGR